MASSRQTPAEEAPGGGAPRGRSVLTHVIWFAESKYKLMRRLADELERAPVERDAAALRRRFDGVVALALRVQKARLVVTVLLAFGVVSTLVTMLLGAFPLGWTGLDVAATKGLFADVAALSASFAIVLVALRLAFDRYLARLDVNAFFLAAQLGAVRERRS